MNKDQENFLRELLIDFKIEAVEHRQAIINGLLMLEKNPASPDTKATIESVFREIHSLKGAARAVNQLDIERLCMSIESIFHEIKKGSLVLSASSFDVFYKALDALEGMLNDIDSKYKKIKSTDVTSLIKSLEVIANSTKKITKVSFLSNPQLEKQSLHNTDLGGQSPVKPIETLAVNQNIPESVSPGIELFDTENNTVLAENNNLVSTSEKSADNETVRISTAKLYSLLQQAEEMVTVKSTMAYFVTEMQKTAAKYAEWNRKNGFDFISGNIDHTGDWEENTRDFLHKDKEFRKKHEEDILNLGSKLSQFQRVTSRMIDDLLLDIKNTLLFPFSSLLVIVPKIVRDLSKEYNKKIDLQIEGGDIEIDRRILEEIKDPLIHLIRNCVDHGIELPQLRSKSGKNPQGVLKIIIKQDLDHNIAIQISDDGAGIQKQKVINSAIKAGFLKAENVHNMSDKEILMLIFNSGVSTSSYITEISGRGIGMAIVTEKVIKLGGTIDLETAPGAGTTFLITLPQTLANFNGILVKASEQLFVIPTSAVVKATRINQQDIKSVESKKTILFNSETIALVNLSDVLNIPTRHTKKKKDVYIQVLVVSIAQKKIAIAVDEVIGNHEGIVKDLGPQLVHVANISGATLLGDGRIVPILHMLELIESASRASHTSDFVVSSSPVEGEKEEVKQKYILVAEDSITIRSMLRNFLEMAGFSVKTAVDGQEAYGFLQNESFDLVVSDIEMPHMNGFELTTKIREDKTLSDMPVVLVTALESADDRQRGMDLGANAYIVKSSFEQSNLVETIRRLI